MSHHPQTATLTGQAAADAGRRTLADAGVDVDALDARAERRGRLLLDVMTAARAVSEGIGSPGTSQRRLELGATVDELAAHDPASATLVAAARWLDRYGSAGAPARLADLQDAVEAAQDRAEFGQIVEPTPEQAAEQRACIGECSCVRDAPAERVDVLLEDPAATARLLAALGDASSEYDEIPCPNCERLHIPDEGEDGDTCVECRDGRNDPEG